MTKIDLLTPPAVAVTNPPVGRVKTGLVVIVKLTALFPAGIETLAGTWMTDGLSVVRLTVPPPTGAGMTSPTEARAGVPPMTS